MDNGRERNGRERSGRVALQLDWNTMRALPPDSNGVGIPSGGVSPRALASRIECTALHYRNGAEESDAERGGTERKRKGRGGEPRVGRAGGRAEVRRYDLI